MTHNSCQAFIEISQGSRIKYEWDHASKILQAVRTLPNTFVFPTNYGFIPKTYAADEDELDIFVFSSELIKAPSIVNVNVVGVLQMTDKGIRDDKIIAYMQGDNSWNYKQEINQWPKDFIEQLHVFYREVKRLENKAFSFLGFEGTDVAMDLIQNSRVLFEEKSIKI